MNTMIGFLLLSILLFLFIRLLKFMDLLCYYNGFEELFQENREKYEKATFEDFKAVFSNRTWKVKEENSIIYYFSDDSFFHKKAVYVKDKFMFFTFSEYKKYAKWYKKYSKKHTLESAVPIGTNWR